MIELVAARGAPVARPATKLNVMGGGMPIAGKVRRVVKNASTADVKVATMDGIVLKFKDGVSQSVEVSPGWTTFYYYARGKVGSRVRLVATGTGLKVDRRIDDKKPVHKAFKFRIHGDEEQP